MYKIEHKSEVDTENNRFREWWVVTNGKRSYECGLQSSAEWLLAQLNCERHGN